MVSGLVLNFVPDQPRAVAEMRRAARPGGTVAVYVWDYAGEMQLIRRFWDAAIALDPAARDLDEAVRFPLCRPDPLRALFEGADLRDVGTKAIDVPTVFADFDDYWSPFLGGQGPAPGYCMKLPEAGRDALRERLRASLPVARDGRSADGARLGGARARSEGRTQGALRRARAVSSQDHNHISVRTYPRAPRTGLAFPRPIP